MVWAKFRALSEGARSRPASLVLGSRGKGRRVGSSSPRAPGTTRLPFPSRARPKSTGRSRGRQTTPDDRRPALAPRLTEAVAGTSAELTSPPAGVSRRWTASCRRLASSSCQVRGVFPGHGGAGTTTAAAAGPWRAADAATLARVRDGRVPAAPSPSCSPASGRRQVPARAGAARRASRTRRDRHLRRRRRRRRELPLWPRHGLRLLARAADGAPDRVLAARAALEPGRAELDPCSRRDHAGTVRRAPARAGPPGPRRARRPRAVLLVIDDLHWSDRTTRELVVSLVATSPTSASWWPPPPAPTASTPPTRCAGCSPARPRPRGPPDRALAAAPEASRRSSATMGATPTSRPWSGAAQAGTRSSSPRPSPRSPRAPRRPLPRSARLVLGRLGGLCAVAQRVVAALSLGEEPVSHRRLAELVGAAERTSCSRGWRGGGGRDGGVDPHVEGYGLGTA